MARIRSIKPAFFTDEEVAALPPLHRLAYQGLWCHADRAGRLEDKPRELRIKILPFDEVDFEAILRDLARPRSSGKGFILRYRVGARRLISIHKFSTHQKPHPKETPSELPGPEMAEPELKTAEHVPATGQPDLGTVEPEKDLVEPGGILVLGSGLLVREPEPRPETAALTPLEQAFVAPPKDRRAQPPPPRLEAPPETEPKPPRGLTEAEQWYAQRQLEREASGWMAELPPNPKTLNAWYADAVKAVGLPALGDAWDGFMRHEHWAKKRCPWAAFAKQWREWAPVREVGPPAEPCRVPGCGKPSEAKAPDETPACYACLSEWQGRWEADGSPQYPKTAEHFRTWASARREAA